MFDTKTISRSSLYHSDAQRADDRERITEFEFAHEGEKNTGRGYSSGIAPGAMGLGSQKFPGKKFKEPSYTSAAIQPRATEPSWTDLVTGEGKPGRPPSAETAAATIAKYQRFDEWFSTPAPSVRKTKHSCFTHESNLFRIFSPKINQYVNNAAGDARWSQVLGDPTLREDIAQEVLVTVLEKLREKDEGLKYKFQRQSCKDAGLSCITGANCCFEKLVLAFTRNKIMEIGKAMLSEYAARAEYAKSLAPDQRRTSPKMSLSKIEE
jgi:hypothetical protein